MKILGLGVPELVVILIVVLLIFGPKNLPKLGKAIGQSVKGLREGMGGDKAFEEEEVVEEAAEKSEKVEQLEAAEEAPKKVVKKVVKKKAEDEVAQ